MKTEQQENRMKRKTWAVITGASSGIGYEFAKCLAKEGYSLILVARRKERLEKAAGELEAEYRQIRCLSFQADLSKLEECERLIHWLSGRKVGVFINNAGFGTCGYFPTTDLAKEMRMIDVNVKAVHFLTKQILRKMQRQGGGYILNVASSAGLFPAGPYMAAYYATKAYVTSLTRAVAEELRQKGSTVYIGCLCPGPVDTEFSDVANVEFALPGISAEYCARYAVSQMKKKKTVIIPTLQMKAAVFAGRFISQNFNIRVIAYQQKKKMDANR